jgi:hypothetical protein
MSSVTQQIIEMLDMLPENEQQFACEVLKRLVLAWDSNYTKVTPVEAVRIAQAKKEIESGNVVCHEDILWK